MSVKDIVLFIVSVLFLGGIVFAVIWCSTNLPRLQDVVNGANIYTQQDLDNKYTEGYNQSIKDIDTLHNQVQELQKENNNLLADNKILQDNIDYYKTYIQNIKQENEYIVTYYVNDVVYYTELVNVNDYAAYNGPTINTDYINLLGWSINKTDIIDLSNYPITEDTDFFAIVDTIAYDVVYLNYDNTEYVSEIVAKGSTITLSTSYGPTKGIDYAFAGWSLDGVNILSTYTITGDTTFIAVFRPLNPYIRLIVNGVLERCVEIDQLNEALADRDYSYTNNSVKPYITLGDLTLTFTNTYSCYDIYVTTSGSEITVSYDNKTVKGTFGVYDYLYYVIEFYIIAEDVVIDNLYYDN